jgi:hypothetical protein
MLQKNNLSLQTKLFDAKHMIKSSNTWLAVEVTTSNDSVELLPKLHVGWQVSRVAHQARCGQRLLVGISPASLDSIAA